MDYNDFYVKSLESGAQPDSFGNITHTPASMATMQMNGQNEQFANESMRSIRDNGQLNSNGFSFWGWLFNDK